MSKSILPHCWVVMLSFMLSGCAIGSYAPTSPHLPDSHQRGNLKASGNIGIIGTTFANGVPLESSPDPDLGFDGELIYNLTNHISCFGGISSNFRFNDRSRNHYDIGLGYLSGKPESKVAFGTVVGVGLGNFSANSKGYYAYNGTGESQDIYVDVNGNAKYMQCYIQPYLLLKSHGDFLKMYFSFKMSALNYYNYRFECRYGRGEFNDPDYYFYDYNKMIAYVPEIATKCEFGKGKLRYFFDIVIPAEFREKDFVFDDNSGICFHIGLSYKIH